MFPFFVLQGFGLLLAGNAIFNQYRKKDSDSAQDRYERDMIILGMILLFLSLFILTAMVVAFKIPITSHTPPRRFIFFM